MKSDWNYRQFGFKFTTYSNPYNPEVPWPCMRGNIANNGRMPNTQKPIKNKGDLFHFHTGNSIFSTPIIDNQERIYIGSADHRFYVLDPHQKKELWQKIYSEIIDSAGCIDKTGNIYVAAGDGQIHAYNLDGTEKWAFNVSQNRRKTQFTFSSLYWYEANIVIGPDGALYAANDDFFLYKMTPNGEIIWAFRTGFLIWSAAAFGPDGTVYIASFDHRLYALNSITGHKNWDIKLNGSLVSSPVIGENGLIYQGSFDGKLYAIDTKTHKIKWIYPTGAHLYATPALASDNTIYCGSTNGIFYAIDGNSGETKWTFYIGDAIRSSAVIGPDIEEKAAYLIYFGGGDGFVYALDPTGNIRWSYNTLIKVLNKDYPNINASIALGISGLAVGSSTGDVIWIPYDYYLRPGAEGISNSQQFKNLTQSIQCHFISPGGKIDPSPISSLVEISPISIISVRALKYTQNSIMPMMIEPSTITISEEPKFPYKIVLQSDGCTINIIPEEILLANTTYSFTLCFRGCNKNDIIDKYDDTIQIRTTSISNSYNFETCLSKPFKIVQMALPQPAIIPSLNQIGFASLTIPFRIIALDNPSHRFIAWGVQKFGGEGSPLNRVSFYAFSGKYQGDLFMMDAYNCLFEITAFSIPLNRFRVAGEIMLDNTQGMANNLAVEKHIGTKIRHLLKEIGGSSPINSQILKQYIRFAGIKNFLTAAIQFFPNLISQINPEIWRSWGLLNSTGDMEGIGRSKILAISERLAEVSREVQVESFTFNDESFQIEVQFLWHITVHRKERAICILIWNPREMKVLPLNYNLVTHKKDTCTSSIMTCDIPKAFQKQLKGYLASLMLDLDLIDSIELC